ncbi:hypothetical protein FHR84_001581 [Actinopolyspora biskrensis]|uniref:DUF397 domain-containing protein n=1 Tax=Actinopolyspora biskrensis TaxID=1470178 RepID=A0A852YXH0_9ACTN|nr:DUF397 domain-containing protein [Actinopolyspora biskrensis]NYH78259.1 hypothetical protein [Actinopolyspora biskrensis]
MIRTELQQSNWRKSSHSSDQSGNCVEVAYPTGGVATRDSKDPDGAVLVFDHPRWNSFLSTTRRGTFDRD